MLHSLNHDTNFGGDAFQEGLGKFFRARNEAHLLFGDDVDAVLMKIHREVQAVSMCIVNAQSTILPAEKIKFVQDNLAHRNTVLNLQDELFSACERYIRADEIF